MNQDHMEEERLNEARLHIDVALPLEGGIGMAENGSTLEGEVSYRYISQSEQETEVLAEKIAAVVVPGMVLTLDGHLGAGKTRFAQGFASALGVQEIVNSPTFTLIKEYASKHIPFYHMDVYRISLEEAEELGLDDYFFGQGVTLLEWSDRVTPLLPEERLEIRIAVEPESGIRTFKLTPHGQAFRDMCESLKEDGIIA